MNQDILVRQLQSAYQLLQQGQREQAEQIGRSLLAQFPDQPDTLNLLGQVEQSRRRFEDARRLYMKGLKIAPTHVHLLNNMGWVEKELNNADKAEAHFLKALKVDPAYFYARQNLAVLYQGQRQYSRAKRLYREVIQQQPGLADAWANLASILEKEHELDEAKSCAGKALEINPNHYVARLTLANIAERNGAFQDVIQLLNPLLPSPRIAPMDRAVMGSKCAQAYEKLGDYQSAFTFFQSANRLLYQLYEPAMQKPDLMYSPAAFRCIEEAIPEFDFSAAGEAVRSPVFLIGFPRSGTTLLDQVLSSHSRIRVLEEKPNLADAFSQFPATREGLRALQAAGESRLEKLRRAYWAKVKQELGTGRLDGTVIDKMPLNAFALLHISRMFPGARIIVALRDPRDSVFSGFQQKFEMNAAMFQLLKLDTAAAFYDQVLNVIMGVHARNAFPLHFVRYEKLVEDFEQEVGALIGFLGLQWEDALFDYQATALGRQVATPSASQVIQPLYRSSIGKWKHYAEWIGHDFEPLAKWVKKLGYSA